MKTKILLSESSELKRPWYYERRIASLQKRLETTKAALVQAQADLKASKAGKQSSPKGSTAKHSGISPKDTVTQAAHKKLYETNPEYRARHDAEERHYQKYGNLDKFKGDRETNWALLNKKARAARMNKTRK